MSPWSQYNLCHFVRRTELVQVSVTSNWLPCDRKFVKFMFISRNIGIHIVYHRMDCCNQVEMQLTPKLPLWSFHKLNERTHDTVPVEWEATTVLVLLLGWRPAFSCVTSVSTFSIYVIWNASLFSCGIRAWLLFQCFNGSHDSKLSHHDLFITSTTTCR